MLFLRVENRVKHIPDIDFLCTLGESTSRGKSEAIGQFGSGFIYTLALFAREGILKDCKFCLGKDVYTPFVKEGSKNDSEGNARIIAKIGLKKQNGGTYDLNVSSGFGQLDWQDVTMGVRELISNAFDGAETYNGKYNTVIIDKVSATECRAKEGLIRVYVPITDAIRDYLQNVEHYFICGKASYNKDAMVLPKTSLSPVNIYRKGVLVHSGHDNNSMFDYNLDIDINESRVIDSYKAKAEAGKAIVMHSTEDQLDKFVHDILVNKSTKFWESSISYWDLAPEYMTNSVEAKKRLNDSIERVIGDTVLCKDTVSQIMVEKKGFTAIVAKDKEFHSLMARANIKKDTDVLSDNEALGNTVSDPNQNVLDILYEIWDKLLNMNLTNGRDLPPVFCFNSAVNAGAQTFGYCSSDYTKIYIHENIKDDKGNQLYSTMLEEVAHYITKSTDFTRDFQSFFVNLAARLMCE